MIVLNRILSLWGDGRSVVKACNVRFRLHNHIVGRSLKKERQLKLAEVILRGDKTIPA